MAFTSGTYFGRLKSGAMTVSSKKKTPQTSLVFAITHVANGAAWEPVKEAERTVNLSWSEGAIDYTEAKLKSLGFDGNFEAMGFDEAASLTGVELKCEIEQYEGKDQERWDLASWGGGSEAAPADVVRAIAAKWKARQAKSGGPPAKAPATPPSASTAPPAPKTTPPPPAAKPAPLENSAGITVTDRDTAWAAVINGHKGDADKATAAWTKTIAAVLGMRDESTATPEEWAKIAAHAELPF